MRISTSPPEYKAPTRRDRSRRARKRRAPEGARLRDALLRFTYRTILRAKRPPPTSRAPAPNASSEAPPVEGSAPPAAAEAEPPPPPPPPAGAEPPPPPPPAVAVTVTAEAEAEPPMLTSLPAAMLPRHALTWFWSTFRFCAMPARSCWFRALY